LRTNFSLRARQTCGTFRTCGSDWTVGTLWTHWTGFALWTLRPYETLFTLWTLRAFTTLWPNRTGFTLRSLLASFTLRPLGSLDPLFALRPLWACETFRTCGSDWTVGTYWPNRTDFTLCTLRARFARYAGRASFTLRSLDSWLALRTLRTRRTFRTFRTFRTLRSYWTGRTIWAAWAALALRSLRPGRPLRSFIAAQREHRIRHRVQSLPRPEHGETPAARWTADPQLQPARLVAEHTSPKVQFRRHQATHNQNVIQQKRRADLGGCLIGAVEQFEPEIGWGAHRRAVELQLPLVRERAGQILPKSSRWAAQPQQHHQCIECDLRSATMRSFHLLHPLLRIDDGGEIDQCASHDSCTLIVLVEGDVRVGLEIEPAISQIHPVNARGEVGVLSKFLRGRAAPWPCTENGDLL
jgi:hypothetical protein